ncbi:MAG: hypothetical protein QJR09_11990 [Micrococcus sp.]|nr:hypothetical protein [Micrococcus sp.]
MTTVTTWVKGCKETTFVTRQFDDHAEALAVFNHLHRMGRPASLSPKETR